LSEAITVPAFTYCHSFTVILLISPAHCAERVSDELAVIRPVFSIETVACFCPIVYVSIINGVFSDFTGTIAALPQLDRIIVDKTRIDIRGFMGI
jgi:hypothetical protein